MFFFVSHFQLHLVREVAKIEVIFQLLNDTRAYVRSRVIEKKKKRKFVFQNCNVDTMTNQKLKADSNVSNLRTEINVGNFEKNRKRRMVETTPRAYESDILFTFTSLTKWVLDNVTDMTSRIKKSTTFRVVTETTQPLHAACIILVAILSMIFFPVERKQCNLLASKFTHLTYFTAFSLHVGSQFWMTFVSGLSLYFNLARHAFGDVQKILFPRYFTMNCVFSAITVVQFGRLHASTFSEWDLHTYLQLVTLTLCFVVEFCIRVYFVPSVLELISMKTTIEKAAGIGLEIGHYDLGPLLQCPHYMSIHRSFRKVHMYTAIGNIVAIMCSAFHLYYLAYKWTVKSI